MIESIQRSYIDNVVSGYNELKLLRRGLELYHNIPVSEYRRLTDEMRRHIVGTILEAEPSLADAMTGADRRYFWKKTSIGIFQVITNRAVTETKSIVFDP